MPDTPVARDTRETLPPLEPITWETLYQSALDKLDRFPIEGGYIYRCIAINGSFALTFVPGATAPEVTAAVARRKSDADEARKVKEAKEKTAKEEDAKVAKEAKEAADKEVAAKAKK